MAAQGMRQVIKDTFFDFTAKREGFTPFMYCDTLNLVTTGVGNLIDRGARNGFDVSPQAMQPAMSLPWKHKGPGWTKSNPIGGAALSQGEIAAAWTATKLRQRDDAAFIAKGGIKQGGFSYSGFTDATLDMDGLKALFQRTLTSFDSTLQSRYPTYSEAPADAQQAILSMSWAMGPAFNFPAFKLAFDAGDYVKAGVLSYFKGGGGSIDARTGRNAENVVMFNNAAAVAKAGGDFDRIYFPGAFSPGGGTGPNGSGSGSGASGAGGGAIAKLPNTSITGIGTTAAVVGGTAAIGGLGWGVFELGKKRKWW